MCTKSEMKVVMGAMTFGAQGKHQARISDLEDASIILDIFQRHGHYEVDTARIYAEGTSEEYLSKLEWQKRGLIVNTKLYPFKPEGYTHTPEGLRNGLEESLRALNTEKVELWYLHGPDRSVPWEVTLKVVNDLHMEGKFDKFGLSNYTSWEVAEIVTLCRVNGWIQPTVYQGLYNAIRRAVEPELLPCLRKFGISFYQYSPLGGGFFTGRYTSVDSTPEIGSRFDLTTSTFQATNFKTRYWTPKYFQALEILKEATQKEGLTMTEAALRWAVHHSQLKKEYGDAIIIGASSTKHVEQNLIDLEKGPIPQSVLDALDQAWAIVQGDVSKYWH
ncbi:Aldo/keto reductase [Ramaria rubella]|nr:Aldo/keto reductase [Ramaria rubella]